ncbi:MAG: hypothetical protein IJI22_02295 [Bacilli bacterium]|nr:hypothetical protein [Bacilli bacterium]
MKKSKKKIELLSVLPIMLGIAIIVISLLYSAKSKIPFTNTVYEDGTISKIVDQEVYVKYEAGGLIRQKKIDIPADKVSTQQVIRIYYNKKNPDKIYIDKSKSIAQNLFTVGIYIIAFGIIFFIIRSRRKEYQNNLRSSGRRISATIKEIKVNKNVTKNGKNPHIVVCSWTNPEDNKTYTFNSPKIWENPGELISMKNITTLTVYVDKKNFNRYIVDINQLR